MTATNRTFFFSEEGLRPPSKMLVELQTKNLKRGATTHGPPPLKNRMDRHGSTMEYIER